MWLNKDAPNSFLTASKINSIREFHELNPNGTVIFSGGEVMLKDEEFFTLTRFCREINLHSIGISNASLINESNYERILVEGPKVLVISLDSHLEDVHDYIRGIKGSYQQTIKALTEIIALRKNKFPHTGIKIFTNTVLFDKNISFCHDYIAFARNLGIDGVSFQSLQKTHENKSTTGSDPFYEKNFFQDKEAAINMIDEISLTYANDDFIITPSDDFKWMKIYIENNDFETAEQVCGSHEKNIFIDEMGNYKLCACMETLEEIKPLGNVKEMGLKEFWMSSTTQDAREIMNGCKKNCGILACHKKEP